MINKKKKDEFKSNDKYKQIIRIIRSLSCLRNARESVKIVKLEFEKLARIRNILLSRSKNKNFKKSNKIILKKKLVGRSYV
jgi:hypothetical protein